MEMKSEIETHSEKETMRFAESMGEEAVAGDVICLTGDLGAGKTRFVKGFVRAFGLDPGIVTSPTFTIIHEYEGTLPIYHFDCYRIEKVGEVLEIGAEEYFYGDGISIIEWPENISAVLPEDAIRIEFEITGRSSRKIRLTQNQKRSLTPRHGYPE